MSKKDTKDTKKTEDVKDTKAKPKTKATPKKKEVKKETKVEKAEEIKEVKEEPKARKKAVDIDLHELIEVRSVTNGGLTYISPKTGMKVRWQETGDVEYMEFAELMTMKSARRGFLEQPLIVIDDEDVVEKLGLTKLYENMFDIDDIDSFFELSVTKMSEQLETMPRGIKTLVADKATKMIKDETLYDLRKIKLLEDKVRIDLQILMD